MNFKETIVEHSGAFDFKKPFRTVTRKNGSEIITVVDNKINATILNISSKSTKSTIELIPDLSFHPIEIVLNDNEQLLCVYDHSNVWVVSLNSEGSLIEHTVKYTIELDLKENEHVLQVIFNNISKYQSEIVVLTTKEIVSYNINVSTKRPVIIYNFEKENGFNFDHDSAVIDPVSICFASAYTNYKFKKTENNPQNDITLFLLTSDASLYKIYPFFPNELSVSIEWLTDLFDSASLAFKSVENEREKTEHLTSLKIAALLCKVDDSHSIVIDKVLPRQFQKGKIAGPISMESYPEDLYTYNALKIIPLLNDILVVVYDQAIAVFHRAACLKMSCASEKFETGESLQILDTVFIDPNQGSILTATPHPTTADSLFVTASNGTILQIDFSQWMNCLSDGIESGDLTRFSQFCQSEKLPTVVIKLGKTNIMVEQPSDISYPLRSHENNIFFAWNSNDIYSMHMKQGSEGVTTVVLINASIENESETVSQQDIAFTEKEQYESLLVGTFATETLPQVKKSLAKIAELNQVVHSFPTTVLNEKDVSTTTLQTVHKLTESVSAGQLILFKTFSLLSNRLRMMALEYQNQINTYHQVMLKKEQVLSRFLRLKSAYSKITDKQNQLLAKMAKVMNDTEMLQSKSNMKGISISYQEYAYFKDLARMKDFVLKKETEFEILKSLLDDVKNAETGIIQNNRKDLLSTFSSRTTLESLKRQLEEQGVFIQHLVEKLATLSKS